MIKLYKNGAWLTKGQEPVSDETGLEQKFHLSKQEAKENTIAYSILKNHNTSENMDFLKLKFDKLTSHDITFVGIIQTARASGLEKFPVPYVLTNLSLIHIYFKSGQSLLSKTDGKKTKLYYYGNR